MPSCAWSRPACCATIPWPPCRRRADARTRLLQSKAAAAEAALEVTDIAMRVCGAAFRKELGIERLFRDARAASVMAPTTDVIYDMLGKGMCDAAA